MAKFMSPETVLARTVEDEKAPIMARYRALQQLAHPSLDMLRRLLVQHNDGSKASQAAKRKKPVPARIRALASLKYAAEIKAQNFRREQRVAEKKNNPTTSFKNALGI
jgi:histidine ammonia-lyase